MMTPVTVVLTSSDGSATRAPGQLTVLTPGARGRRVAAVLGASLVAAAMLIPVPIVHLVGIPLVVIIGIGVAVRQGRAVARLAPMHLDCPRCGERNSLGGGLGFTSATGPIARSCESCRRPLELRFELP